MTVLSNSKIDIDGADIFNLDQIARIETNENIVNLAVIFNSSEKSASNDLYIVYNAINKIIKRMKKLALVITDEHDEAAKLLCLLLAKNMNYNVYVSDDITDIDIDYLDAIMEQEASIDDLADFVGRDIASYNKTRTVISDLTSSYNKTDGTIAKTVRENVDDIRGVSSIMELLQSSVDTACGNLAIGVNARSADAGALARVTKELQSAQALVQDAEREKNSLKKKLEIAEARVTELETFKADTEKKIEETPLTDKVISIDVNKWLNRVIPGRKQPSVKSIIYFKEVSPCQYINSMVHYFTQYLRMKYEASVKLVIYDRKGYNNFRYGSLPIVDGGAYEKIKGHDEMKEAFVATEAARNIIEDVMVDNQIVVIYDRFNQPEDILTGFKVHKYYVVNNFNEYELVKKKDPNIKKNMIVTTFGVDKNMVSIAPHKKYKTLTPGGKFQAYVNVPSTIDSTKTTYNVMISDCGLAKIFENKQV